MDRRKIDLFDCVDISVSRNSQMKLTFHSQHRQGARLSSLQKAESVGLLWSRARLPRCSLAIVNCCKMLNGNPKIRTWFDGHLY